MRIKEFLILILYLLLGFVLCSCGVASSLGNTSKEYNPSEISANDYPFAVKTMESVLKCFNENDKETLKKLFSESISSKNELDKQIENALVVYEGKSISHNDIRSGIYQKSSKDGQYEYKSIRVVLENVVTDNDKTYNIEMIYVLVNEKDTAQIGISKIFLRDPNNIAGDNIAFIGET